VPAGADDTGMFVLLFGLRFAAKESALGLGDSGVENGCAGLGETAAGSLVAGDNGEAVVARARDRSEGIR